jgi:hypothetical protein
MDPAERDVFGEGFFQAQVRIKTILERYLYWAERGQNEVEIGVVSDLLKAVKELEPHYDI